MATSLPDGNETSDPSPDPDPDPDPDRGGRLHHGVAAALVAAGGTVGTAARVVVSHAVPHLGGIPVGILVINLAGGYLLGLLLEVLARLGSDTGRRRHLRLLLGTGVLGGFTTYSALAVDTAVLLDTSHVVAGVGYSLCTVIIGGLASWAGILTGRAVPTRAEHNLGGAA